MRHPVLGFVVMIAAASLLMLPLSAHHEITAKFDPSKTTRLQGVVTNVDWANPHVHIFMNVGTGNNIVNWAVELESVIDLQKAKYTRDTVKPGDSLTVEGILARDGSKQVWGNRVTLAGKQIFNVPEETVNRAPGGPTPRWPDGKPRLGPVPATAGLATTGYWARPSMSILAETGTNIRANKNGLLANISDASKVAPFQPWAKDLFELRQRNRLADDPQYLYCLPPGGPRQFQEAYGVQLVEDKDHQRIFVFVGGVNHNWRLIYLDGRQQVGQLRGDSDNPLYYGRAVGKWENDTLVVDTKGFNEKFWFSNGGLPHTDKLHLVERFTRLDTNTLKYEVSIDDPGAYTRTWSSGWNLQWVAGEELPAFYCQDNRP
jgi:Family of unknown function (DUF6152)